MLKDNFLYIENYQKLSSYAIEVNVKKVKNIKTLSDINTAAKLISSAITTRKYPEENVKLYLLQKYFHSMILPCKKKEDTDSLNILDHKFTSGESKEITKVKVIKEEDNPEELSFLFHGGKDHIVNKLSDNSAHIDSILIKHCLDKIENNFDIRNKTNQKFATELTHVDVDQSYPISSGRKNGKTVSLFFTFVYNNIKVIAAGQHAKTTSRNVKSNFYSIQWSLPSISFPSIVVISEKMKILNKRC